MGGTRIVYLELGPEERLEIEYITEEAYEIRTNKRIQIMDEEADPSSKDRRRSSRAGSK